MFRCLYGYTLYIYCLTYISSGLQWFSQGKKQLLYHLSIDIDIAFKTTAMHLGRYTKRDIFFSQNN